MCYCQHSTSHKRWTPANGKLVIAFWKADKWKRNVTNTRADFNCHIIRTPAVRRRQHCNPHGRTLVEALDASSSHILIICLRLFVPPPLKVRYDPSLSCDTGRVTSWPINWLFKTWSFTSSTHFRRSLNCESALVFIQMNG